MTIPVKSPAAAARRTARLILNLLLVLLLLAAVGERLWLDRNMAQLLPGSSQALPPPPAHVPAKAGPRGLPPPEFPRDEITPGAPAPPGGTP